MLAVPAAFAIRFGARLEQRVVALHRRRRRHYSFGRLVGSRDRTALSTNRLRYRRILNATFGNAAELIIALMALSKGLTTVVKASLTGSIIGDLLLVLGASALAGGGRFSHQSFQQDRRAFRLRQWAWERRR